MSRTGRAQTGIVRTLLFIALLALLLLIVWQLSMQHIFLNRIHGIYEGNMAYILEVLVGDLKSAFSFQGTAVDKIAGDQETKEYAAAADTSQRYTKAYSTMRPMINSAFANSLVDVTVIFDNTQAWYQFNGTLSSGALRALRAAYWDRNAQTNEVIELDGSTFLCASAPIMQFQNSSRFAKVGMVVALTNISRFRASLGAFDFMASGKILLHDGNKVLLSSDASLEGALVSSVNMNPAQHYLLHEDVLNDLIKVSIILPRSSIFPTRGAFAMFFLGVGVFAILLFAGLTLLVNRQLISPLSKIMNGLQSLGHEGLSGRLSRTGIKYMDTLTDGINDTLSRLEDANDSAMEAQQTAYETRLARQEIEMVLMHKQIDTHFFYNSLISIKYLSDCGENQKAGQMARGIAALLRYVHSTQERKPIFDEMSAIQSYAQIMNIRFDNKFTVSFDVDDCLSEYLMPRMLLQPLVENAMLHGLESREAPCLLEIRGRIEGERAVLSVWDNGVGIDPQKLHVFLRGMNEEADAYEYLNIKGISLINIHRRIRLAFGPNYGLEIESAQGVYTLASISFPLIPMNS